MTNVMDKLDVALGDYPPRGEPYTAMLTDERQSLLDLLKEVKALYRKKNSMEITMPCGYSQVFREPEDIPFEDLPCQCGQAGRYLIRYEKE